MPRAECHIAGQVLPRLVSLLRLSCAVILLAASGVCAEDFSEVDVRAVFLFNFSIFVDWPAEAFESATSTYRYCVLGSRALSVSLSTVLAEEKVGQRRLNLISANAPEDWRRCHVLYLDSSASQGAGAVLRAVKGAPVLTVGDTESFAHTGGMVALVRKAGRLHAVVNRAAAEREGIRISSKLLRLTTIVSDEGG